MTHLLPRSATTPALTRPAPPDAWRLLSILLALAIPMAIGLDMRLMSTLSVGMALALAITPVWVKPASQYVGARSLLVIVLLCLVSTVLLSQWSDITHPFSRGGLIEAGLLLIGGTAAVGALLWCRTVLPLGLVAGAFAAGSLIDTVIAPSARMGENPWKFGFAMPITIGLLAISALIGKWWLDVAILGALALLGAAMDSRSASALLAVAMLLVIWQHRPQVKGARRSPIAGLAFLISLGLLTFYALQNAILDGYLGAETQMRTQAQIDQSGSLILGGRPEIGATLALMSHRPWGYGGGIAPTMGDVGIAKSGMAQLGYDPNNGYVERYMFGQGHFEVHSLIGNFWIVYGIAGLLLAAAIAWIVARYIGNSLATTPRAAGTAVGYFLAVRLLWDLAFSPIHSSTATMLLTLGLLMIPAVKRDSVRRRVPFSAEPPLPLAQVGATCNCGHGRHCSCDSSHR